MPSGIEAAFQGRIGADPLAKTTGAGKAWLSLRVAVAKDDVTEWIAISYWNSDAHELGTRLAKGQEVYAEGRLSLNSWQKNGETRHGLNLVAWRLEPLGEIGRRRRPRPRSPRAAQSPPSSQGKAFHDDEIPL